jgi:hypothetical protein
MGKIALAIVCGSLAIAAAIALSNRYSVSVNGASLTRIDHITGELVVCGVNEEKAGFCVRFPTDRIRPLSGPVQPPQ